MRSFAPGRLLSPLVAFSIFSTSVLAVDVAGRLEVVARDAAGKPVSGARIRAVPASGQGVTPEGTTGADGVARFDDVAMGDYSVELAREGFQSRSAEVRVGASGTTRQVVDLAPRPTDPKPGEAVAPADAVIEVRSTRLLVNPKAPVGITANRLDFVSDRNLTSITQPNATQAVVQTVPGVQVNSVGQFHARGEHKAVGLSVDGVNIPILAEDSTAQFFDPRLLQSMEVQTGFFDSSAGGQLGALLNVKTPEGGKETRVELVPTFGEYDTASGVLRASGSSQDGRTRWYLGALRSETDNKLNPVQPFADELNNHGEDTNLVLRLSHVDGKDTFGSTFSLYDGEYGVPQTRQNFAAGVRQQQLLRNFLGVVSARRQFSPDATGFIGLAFLRARQGITSNGAFTTFTPFDAALNEELAEERAPADPTNPGSPYVPSVRRISEQVQPTVEFTKRFPSEHVVKAGGQLTYIRTREDDLILDLGGGGGLPFPGGIMPDPPVDADGNPLLDENGEPVAVPPPTEFRANIRRRATLSALYIGDTFPVGDKLVVNVGLRAEHFDDDRVDESQLSPRANLAYDLGRRQVLRASYNRAFNAPPLEVDTSGRGIAFPQRTHQGELAYEFQPADRIVGRVAGVYKDISDQLDVGLLIPNSNVPVFGPLNFGKAFYRGLELSLNTSYLTGFNGFLAATLFTYARPLTAGPFTSELPRFNDHDQRNQVNGGLNYTWKSGITLGGDALYASGFPQEFLPRYNEAGITPFGKRGQRFDRTVANVFASYQPRDARGKVKQTGIGGSVVVQNVFDEREVINFLSEFSGTRFQQGRRTLVSANLRF